MKNLLMTILILLSYLKLNAQADYSDVAVIVNDNSPVSQEIATYYKNARNIPEQNMIHITCSTDEEVDSLEFENIRDQIENYLISSSLATSINYIVTTKGVPLRVLRTPVMGAAFTNNMSLESDLCLILGPYSHLIGKTGLVQNPFTNAGQHFSHNAYGIYLVSRLDGYTKEDIFASIDNSAPELSVDPDQVLNLIDISWNPADPTADYFESFLIEGYNDLVALGWNTQYETTPVQVTEQNNLLFYSGIKQNTYDDTINCTWAKGAICNLGFESTSVTFNEGAPGSELLTTADLIAEGCTGSHGFVNPMNFISQAFRDDIFIAHFFNDQEDYNLAESMYAAIESLSWTSLVTGDPKASVNRDPFADLSATNMLEVALYPNPCIHQIHLKSSFEAEHWVITDLQGQTIRKATNDSGKHITIVVTDLPQGTYFIRLMRGNEFVTQKFVKTN